MKKAISFDIEKLREIGWRDWDPIRLGAPIEAIDEYDNYLVWAAFQFSNGASIAEVTAYLKRVADVDMYVGATQEACELTATNIAAYIAGLRG